MNMDFPHKDMKRARRRADKERKVKREEKKIEHIYSDPSHRWDGFDEWKEKYIRKHADNPTSCSCWICQNPRRANKHKKQAELTLQEKKISQRERFCE